ncbi:MAG: hypothetical protein U9O98_06895 [Asgard group archaeon]|nr:hypothetical protein [Asgard group archaeon]
MPKTRFNYEIDEYGLRLWQLTNMNYLGETVKIQGEINCRGKYKRKEFRFIIAFIPDAIRPPQPIVNMEYRLVILFVHIKNCQPYIDMLRYEKPIYGYVDTENPSNCCITTSGEEIGEEE